MENYKPSPLPIPSVKEAERYVADIKELTSKLSGELVKIQAQQSNSPENGETAPLRLDAATIGYDLKSFVQSGFFLQALRRAASLDGREERVAGSVFATLQEALAWEDEMIKKIFGDARIRDEDLEQKLAKLREARKEFDCERIQEAVEFLNVHRTTIENVIIDSHVTCAVRDIGRAGALSHRVDDTYKFFSTRLPTADNFAAAENELVRLIKETKANPFEPPF